ncbi:MAG TPA: DUF4864 domain-containing protein [Rhodospirillaceae bacterium]|nr:DUF4864 domain-containing protein [Rhodospirillaceae bacterium]MAX63596.1 DUF4864 domain-containing protein [Rhodospirillaceae bacterium]MBB56332.1 DUF4864 domain-containing protein [Rhodospirillaceae bacterium]HAE01094.1 DUF4864 domain-containing protein [Rhodospirillaceae bacterium]HBM11959.1 DUF4864 domain-containing protein [Rhodospirillaceae bacterium]|tara:strand:- start:109057 stop:109482 length:426 start_codon:yes stop_codon:yes gene_type:complete
MKHMFRWVLVGLLMGLWATTAGAQGDPAQATVKRVIQDQLSAFAQGDKTSAYSHAAPIIQQRFSNPDIFMQMVTSGYPALISPKIVDFKDYEIQGGRVEQDVMIIASDGSAWMAHYSLQQMEDGTWRISGCWLEQLPGGSV